MCFSVKTKANKYAIFSNLQDKEKSNCSPRTFLFSVYIATDELTDADLKLTFRTYPIKHSRSANKCVFVEASEVTLVLIWWWQWGHVINWLSGPRGVGITVGITTTARQRGRLKFWFIFHTKASILKIPVRISRLSYDVVAIVLFYNANVSW